MKAKDLTQDSEDGRLTCRAVRSASTNTDSRILNWIYEESSWVLEKYEDVYCALAENEHISLVTALALASDESYLVREIIASNRSLPASVLYILSFDDDTRVRTAAQSNPSMSYSLSAMARSVKEQNRSIFDVESSVPGSSNEDKLPLTTYPVISPRSEFLTVALQYESFWEAFSAETRFPVGYLKGLVSLFCNVSAGR